MMHSPLLYFDHATTSYPKPLALSEALAHFYDEPIGSYARSGDRVSLSAAIQVEDLRSNLSERLGINAADHVCFTDNATTGINTILRGIDWQEGDKIYVSPLEHNAVWRPLVLLSQRYKFDITIMPHHSDGSIDLERFAKNIPPSCRLALLNLESNVNGLVQPYEAICQVLKERGIAIMVDTAQYLTVGTSLEVDSLGIDYLAFTGHKGLLGPTGTGGFYVREPETVMPLTLGGTGIRSEDLEPSSTMPDRYMAGTINTIGLVGLQAAMADSPKSYAVKQADFLRFLDELGAISDIHLLRAIKPEQQGYVASFTHNKFAAGVIADRMREVHGISMRYGLQCAPMAHCTLGTLSSGVVRFSIGPYHTTEDLHFFLQSLHDVLR